MIVSLEFLPGWFVDYIYEGILKLKFSDQNVASPRLQKLGSEFNNFFAITGSVTVFVMYEIILGLTNEFLLGLIIIKIIKKFNKK
jgi:hypothetical protein